MMHSWANLEEKQLSSLSSAVKKQMRIEMSMTAFGRYCRICNQAKHEKRSSQRFLQMAVKQRRNLYFY